MSNNWTNNLLRIKSGHCYNFLYTWCFPKGFPIFPRVYCDGACSFLIIKTKAFIIRLISGLDLQSCYTRGAYGDEDLFVLICKDVFILWYRFIKKDLLFGEDSVTPKICSSAFISLLQNKTCTVNCFTVKRNHPYTLNMQWVTVIFSKFTWQIKASEDPAWSQVRLTGNVVTRLG